MINFLDITGDKFLEQLGVEKPTKPTISVRWRDDGAYSAEYYKRNKENLKKRRREYYFFNKVKIAEKKKVWYYKNREKVLLYQRERYYSKSLLGFKA